MSDSTSSDPSSLRLERRGAALVATIEREARSNALDRATLLAFVELRKLVESSSDLKLLVITGAGQRTFCAGADLKERAAMTEDQVRTQLDLYPQSLGWLDKAPVLTVAALNGAALGGGLELALACDLRSAAPHARLGLPETTLGIIPGAGGTQRLPRIVGQARALEIILLGRHLNTEDALRFGLLNHVTAPGENLIDATLTWLEPVLAGSATAQSAALLAVRQSSLPLAAGLAIEREQYERCLVSEERRRALASFQSKNKG